ncbi:hypothetical protein KR222_009077, partial [Zaprionus bogoriensis]
PEQREDQEGVLVTVDEEVLRLFVRKVYVLAIIFLAITCSAWITVSVLEYDIREAIVVPYIVWLITALTLMFIMNCIPQTRFCFPCNWIMTILIVGCVAVAGTYLYCSIQYLLLLILMGIAAIIVVVFYAIGAFCPQKMLPNVLCTMITALVLIIVLFVLVIVLIFIRSPILLLCFALLLFCLLGLLIIFNAQYIHARYEILPIFDMLHCSLNIFFHYVIMLYVLCHFYIYYEQQQ